MRSIKVESPDATDAKTTMRRDFRITEERLLRALDTLKQPPLMPGNADSDVNCIVPYDQRWLAIARTHIQQGFDAIERSIVQPKRIKLPEDE